MTEMQSDMETVKTKLDLVREDIRRLFPILSLLEPQDRDQISGFAERLIQFMGEIDASYRDQAAEFSAMKVQLRAINAKLEYLIGDDDLAENG